MLDFQVDPASAARVDAHLETTRQRVLAGIRNAMQEAMEGLAWTVADKLQGNPIVSRSGRLLGAVLGSPKVKETDTVIRGTVSADVGGKHLGLWLEDGTHVPAVAGKIFSYTAPGGEQVFARGHKAFEVKPHPFMNPSLQEYKATILQMIAARVTEAVANDAV
jgi:hypothetical protein